MGTLRLRRTLNHSAQTIWPHIKDFKNVQRILPMISHADLTSSHACGLGAERVCYMKGGGFAIHERVLEWKEGESYTIEVYKTSMPLMKQSVTTLGVRPVSDTSAEVFFESNYSVKYGLVGKVIDVMMMNLMMRFLISGLFGAIDRQARATTLPAGEGASAT